MALNLSGIQAGTVQSNDLNDPNVRVIRGKNQFPQSFYHPSTCRYGEVDPVFVMRCERGDTVPYRFATDLNTFTMASPMKSPVNMYSAAFKVPLEAIYPRNYEIMYAQPNKGDDVPEDTRALLDPVKLSNVLISGLIGTYNRLGYSNDFARNYVRNILLLESIFSSGSLFSKFNMHLDSWKMTITTFEHSGSTVDLPSMYFDEWFDTYFAPTLKSWFDGSLAQNKDDRNFYHLIDNLFDDDNVHRYVVTDDKKLIGEQFGGTLGNPITYISFRRALELLRTGEYDLNFAGADDYNFGDNIEYPTTLYSFYQDLNIEPIIAYQLCCAHFFTNSKVDFIYDAKLWRDNMQSLFPSYEEDGGLYTMIMSFNWNGITKPYDVMSKGYWSPFLLTEFYSILFDGEENLYYYRRITSFWFNLFSYQRSLRYGDYFTGSRPEPIAPGDINTPVIDGSVNALLLTRRLQLTRFLNKVNISGPRIQDYLRALFGGRLPEAPKDVPVRLSVERFNVSGFEVNNTGDAQLNPEKENITTTNLRLDESRYMFEAEIEEPCILLAVQYFDAHRIYSRTMDRFAWHKNRYDDFIPDMQFTGDQDVKQRELDFANGNDAAFAYNLRYMEYKSRYSYASGGFVRSLPSWAFVTDNNDGNPSGLNIDPDYIRSSPSEFDRFYKSLSGYSLGSYFHFITFNTNICAPYRQMVYAPEILA